MARNARAKARQKKKQIPRGNDRKKNKDNRKGKCVRAHFCDGEVSDNSSWHEWAFDTR
jgi:hypothetical protein